MNKGLLTSWNDNRGYGFIKSSSVAHDTFIHISSLKHMNRKPKVGDTIYFEVATDPNGKSKAVNCRIEGVIESKVESKLEKTAAFNKPFKMSKAKKKSSTLANLVALAIILSIGFSAYNRYFANTHAGNKNNTPVITNADLTTFDEKDPKAVIPKNTQNFSCDGRQHCSQMTSRAEAVFFIKNCPNTKMDGDNDGIPCENDSRF